MLDESNRPKWYIYLIIGVMIGVLLATIFSNAWLGLGLGLGLSLVAYLLPMIGNLRTQEDDEKSSLYQHLVDRARGDKALVERLINYELKQNPHLDRSAATRRALDRWDRDRR